ncbi:MAG TPA: hypothetical protein VFI37_14760 [Gaiellaceae bacterium]|nr:hypothetical protein [Gaiellaceae bacterium]
MNDPLFVSLTIQPRQQAQRKPPKPTHAALRGQGRTEESSSRGIDFLLSDPLSVPEELRDRAAAGPTVAGVKKPMKWISANGG